MFVYQNLLGVVLNGHCCVYHGYWKETWYLLVWNLACLQLQSKENDCPLFYQIKNWVFKVLCLMMQGGEKRPHSDDR